LLNLSVAIRRFSSILLLILIWFVTAMWWQNSMLPPPDQVLSLIWQELHNGQLWYHLSATLMRVLISFIIAMLLGSIIGILMGRSKITDQLLDPWLIVFLNIPALVIIILSKETSLGLIRQQTSQPDWAMSSKTQGCSPGSTYAIISHW
jgi:NitT/TauT family transport system permease protein